METQRNRIFSRGTSDQPLGPREVRYLRIRRATNFIWLLFGILEGWIGIRILLKLIGANPGNPFAGLVYSTTEPFLVFFKGLTVNPAYNNVVLELHSLIAIMVYALANWAIVRLVWLIFYRPEDIP